MILTSRSLGAMVVLILAVTLIPTIVLATLSSSYSVEGVETAATSTKGTFVGTGAGTSGDEAVWQAVVQHQPLSPGCYSSASGCAITGGTFSLVNQDVEAVNGEFASGSITLISQAPGCGIQVFSVLGTLTDVTTPTTGGGGGTFAVTLTHFRALYFGRCTTFFAKVSGSVSF
jgi:hypothetical protein